MNTGFPRRFPILRNARSQLSHVPWRTYTMAVIACVGIDTVEAADFPALPVAVPSLVWPLRFIVGFSTCTLVLTGRGCTSAFLIPDLGIVSSIVVLRGRII